MIPDGMKVAGFRWGEVAVGFKRRMTVVGGELR